MSHPPFSRKSKVHVFDAKVHCVTVKRYGKVSRVKFLFYSYQQLLPSMMLIVGMMIGWWLCKKVNR